MLNLGRSNICQNKKPSLLSINFLLCILIHAHVVFGYGRGTSHFHNAFYRSRLCNIYVSLVQRKFRNSDYYWNSIYKNKIFFSNYFRGGSLLQSTLPLSQNHPFDPSLKLSKKSFINNVNEEYSTNNFESLSPFISRYNQSQPLIYFDSSTKIQTYLQTNIITGLSSEEASKRLNYYGLNVLDIQKEASLIELLLEQLNDRFVQILIVIAFLSGFLSYMDELNGGLSKKLTPTSSTSELNPLKKIMEPIIILSILTLNTVIGIWQTKMAQHSLLTLNELQPTLTTVLRDEKWTESRIHAKSLVPGDIISLKVGDKISADCILLSLNTNTMRVDECCLTGESVSVYKEVLPLTEDKNQQIDTIQYNETSFLFHDMKHILFSGTKVTSGSGIVVVVRTGMATEIGKIQKGINKSKKYHQGKKTPLGIKVDEFGKNLTSIIGAICIIIWCISIPKFNDQSMFPNGILEGALHYFKTSIALGVAAIPEGLPAVITLCLSLGSRRMVKRNVIVRKLQSVETLGCTSVICTDKTGTLTTNEMTVVSLVLLEDENKVIEHSISGSSYNPIGNVDGIIQNDEVRTIPYGAVSDCAAVSALCNDAKIVGYDQFPITANKNADRNKRIIGKEYERVGEPTEAALCILVEKLGGMNNMTSISKNIMNFAPSKLADLNVNGWRSMFYRSATLEFSNERKSMSVLCHPKRKGSRVIENRLLVKGAPNLLLNRCTHVKFRDGTIKKLSVELRRSLEIKVSELGSRPLRCLALAIKNNEQLDQSLKTLASRTHNHLLLNDFSKYTDIESGLTLVGIVGIKDPARPDVGPSINACKTAGIRVIMITGDARDTAIAIARDVNIFPTKEESLEGELKVYEGQEFFRKSGEEQVELLKDGNIVFYRAQPSEKQKLVEILQSLNEVVAMTGDGINDAPALQQSDIGVAMGITGTEVAKDAGDMILVDDNFSTIVRAVKEGRCIYSNMQSFIYFLISCNIGEIFVILLATIIGVPEPLSTMHLLWVNLVTDGPPATALGFNPPTPDLMKKPPRKNDDRLINKWICIRYIITGFYVGVATVGIFVNYYRNMGITLSQLSTWNKCGNIWSPSDSSIQCSDIFAGSGRILPQTLALTTLVCMEMLKALSSVSLQKSIFILGPHTNKWLLLGVIIPMLLHITIVYSANIGFTKFGQNFGVVPLSFKDWINVLQWSAPVLVIEEIMKIISRKTNINREIY